MKFKFIRNISLNLLAFILFFSIISFIKLKNNNLNGLDASNHNIIFIGGSPRSGTTLMRVMLDAHPLIRCGDETRIIPRFLKYIRNEFKSSTETKILEEARITKELINKAASSFILEILKSHSNYSTNLCAKDPTTFLDIEYLAHLFSNSKFILMIRDARAIINSVHLRGITVGGFVQNFKENFKIWNNLIEEMYSQCVKVRPNRCMMVYYEQLILHPESQMKQIFKFLNVTWDQAVLNHEKYIGNQISISEYSKSADQVIKPINLDGLYSWVGQIPQDVLDEIDVLAPMLKKLGYDTQSPTPNYGDADNIVIYNTFSIKLNFAYWHQLAKNFSIYRRFNE